VESEHLVVMKIALLDGRVFYRNFAAEDRRQSEVPRAFDLRAHAVGIDGEPTIDGTNDAVYTNDSIRDGHFGYVCNVGVTEFAAGNSSALTPRQRFAPIGFR